MSGSGGELEGPEGDEGSQRPDPEHEHPSNDPRLESGHPGLESIELTHEFRLEPGEVELVELT